MRASKAQLVIVAVLVIALAASMYMLLFRKPAAAPAKPGGAAATAEAKGAAGETAKASEQPGPTRDATRRATADKPAPRATEPGKPAQVGETADQECPPGVQPGLWAAWGTYGKQRPSQAAAASAPGTDLAAVAEGTSYTGMEPEEIDKAREEEKAGPLPDGRAFRLRQTTSPFKRPSVAQLAALRGQAPSAEAPPETKPGETDSGDEEPPKTASTGTGATAPTPSPPAPSVSAPPTAIASGLPPAIGSATSGAPLPTVGATVEVQPQPQRPAFAGGHGFPQATTGPRSAAKPGLNLRLTGTVVATDGRSSAVITDGANTFYVRAGQTFRAGGREFRVVSVTQGAVEVEHQQRRLTLGIGGAAP